MDESPLNLFLSLPSWIVPSLFPIALAIYFQMRSGSSYSLINRLYALLIGGSEFTDAKLKKFWEERTDVERFNALFHMQAKTIKEIHWFQKRVQKNELNIQFFSNMRGGFDSKLRKIKKISPWAIALIGGLLLGVLLSIQPLFFIASADGAILKFKSESQWISLNKEGASSVNLYPPATMAKAWTLKKSTCDSQGQSAIVEATKLLDESVAIICRALKSTDNLDPYEKVIKDQKDFWYIGILYVLVAAVLIRLLFSLIHTIRGRKELLKAYLQARRNRILRSNQNKVSTTDDSKAPLTTTQLEEVAS